MPSQSEITARLNGDNSNFRSMMNSSERIAEQGFKRLTKNLDLRDASRTMAAAVGLNIDSIAENFARMWTNVTKEGEEALKRIAEISDQILELRNKRMEDRRTTGQQIITLEREANGLTQQREAIEKRIAFLKTRTGVSAQLDKAELDLKENEYAIEKNISALTDARKKAQKETNAELEKFFDEVEKLSAEREKSDEQALKVAEEYEKKVASLAALKKKDLFDAMTAEEQLASLQKDAAQLQKEISEEKKQGVQDVEKETELYKIQQQIKARLLKITKDQVAEEVSLISEWKDFMVKVSSYGRGDEQLSDRELERKLQAIKDDIFQRELNQRSSAGLVGSAPYDPFLTEQKFNLQRLLGEIQLREDVRRSNQVFGEQAAFNMFPGITESRLREILGNNTEQQKQTDLLQELVDQQRKGIVTIPMGG